LYEHPLTVDSSPIDLSTITGDTIIDQAINYINANTATYTLLIGQDISVAGSTGAAGTARVLNAANAKLTIIGIGGIRELSLSSDGRFFTIGASGQTGISLTLGNNITIKKGSGAGYSYQFIVVQNDAELIMEAGSKITNVSANQTDRGALYIDGSTFTMNGGSITGNSNSQVTGGVPAGGLNVNGTATIRLLGGSIEGNVAPMGDIYIPPTATLTLSGTAKVGTLTIDANSDGTIRSQLNINSDWTGTIGALNLRGDWSSIDANLIGFWATANPILTGTGVNAASIGRITLGSFIANVITVETPVQPISNTHKISTDTATLGRLVQK